MFAFPNDSFRRHILKSHCKLLDSRLVHLNFKLSCTFLNKVAISSPTQKERGHIIHPDVFHVNFSKVARFFH